MFHKLMGLVIAIMQLVVVSCCYGNAKLDIRGVWVPYYEIEKSLKAENENDFRSNLVRVLDKLEKYGINRVIMHVRPFSDAMYPSKIFPWSKYISGEQGKDPGFDPIAILIEEVHKRGMEFEAWVNPLRVKLKDDSLDGLSESNPAFKWITQKKRCVKRLGEKGIWYNPAYKSVRKLVADGVKEIVSKYDVDSIQFDDYFYPTTDPEFDRYEYEKSGATMSLAEWRRSNIDKLVRGTYKVVHKTKSNVRFGISPQGNKKNNKDRVFIDTEKWCQKAGYIDYICPQIYYGFKNETCPFESTLTSWVSDIAGTKRQLIVGIAGYKIGNEDQYAGESGKNEWILDKSILKKQKKIIEDTPECDGFYLFDLESINKLNLNFSSK